MLTLGAWAPHPNVHLAQIKTGKSISKGRANISRTTSQIKSGCIDSSPGCLLHMQGLLSGPVISKRSSHWKHSTWRIKEICSLWNEVCYEVILAEFDSVLHRAQELVASGCLSWMSVGLAPYPFQLQGCAETGNRSFSLWWSEPETISAQVYWGANL